MWATNAYTDGVPVLTYWTVGSIQLGSVLAHKVREDSSVLEASRVLMCMELSRSMVCEVANLASQ